MKTISFVLCTWLWAPFTIKAQDGPMLGIQTGYSWRKTNYWELAGLNAYFTGNVGAMDNVFGPAAILTGTRTDRAFYLGTRFSFNYTLCPDGYGTGFRLAPAFEINPNGDRRLGFDIGVSALGVYPYIGFYWPVSRYTHPEIIFFVSAFVWSSTRI